MIYRTAPLPITLNNATSSFKVTPFFDAEYLINGTTCRHSFNEILIGTYTRPTQQCHFVDDFEWPWVILSELAQYSMTWSVVRSLCDSWASCLFTVSVHRYFLMIIYDRRSLKPLHCKHKGPNTVSFYIFPSEFLDRNKCIKTMNESNFTQLAYVCLHWVITASVPILVILSQRHVAGDTHQRHMPERDALGLDYCISTPEVQLIQSQSVHNKHMQEWYSSV